MFLTRRSAIAGMLGAAGTARLRGAVALDFPRMAGFISRALKVQTGERVLLRQDPEAFGGLTAPLRKALEAVGARITAVLDYPLQGASGDSGFEKLLNSSDIYIWSHLNTERRHVPPKESKALEKWLDAGGSHREIHFHWAEGSVFADGVQGRHSAVFDEMYQDALDIDYAALSARMDRAIAELRSGPVRVRTREGTDITFRVGDRPFNKQDGDASRERMSQTRVRVDREIELPAGVLRVAPLEESANGQIIVNSARFGPERATGLQLLFENGQVKQITADTNAGAAKKALSSRAAKTFREFGLGFNPKLVRVPGNPVLPYYGYGAGVVRLSVGDNQELGGAVRGDGFRRWFFFPEATVEAGGRNLADLL